MIGRKYCYFHDDASEMIELRNAATSKVGRMRATPSRVGEWTSRPIEATEDLRQGLAEAFDQ
jgi:hypothetical protein